MISNRFLHFRGAVFSRLTALLLLYAAFPTSVSAAPAAPAPATTAAPDLALALVGFAQSPPPPAPSTSPASQTPVADGQNTETSDTPKVDDSWHPSDVKKLAEYVGSKKLKFKEWDGLQLYCDDPKQFKLLSAALDKAWPAAMELLGSSPIPDGMPFRVVALKDPEAIRAYWKLLQKGSEVYQNAAPPEAMLAGLLKAGSTRWNLPPTVMLRPGTLASSAAPTRAVHDVGVVLAGWACSYSGYGGPEFLTEGFAGMLQRRSIKSPAAIVSHDQAALTETIHGYGVFAAIGAAMNDSSNSPNNWPRMMHNAIKQMLKDGETDENARIDALLLRTNKQFARSDYGYAWATMEYLFDDSGHSEEDDEDGSRRQRLLRVLKVLQGPREAAMGQQARSMKFRKLLLEEYDLTAEDLHQDFLTWASKHLPKK